MRQLFNDGWQFLLSEPDSRLKDVISLGREEICLPHDWAIGDVADFYRDADGWYFRSLDMTAIPPEHDQVFLRVDGVYMDACVYVNGQPAAEHHYGYTAFSVRLSGLLRPGLNEVAVQVRYRNPNSRWYSGAGIFRDVELLSFRSGYLVPDGLAVSTKRSGTGWKLTLHAETAGAAGLPVRVALYDGERCLWDAEATADEAGVQMEGQLADIRSWGLDDPYLYRLELSLQDQTERVRIGFRETEFTTDRGFFLNGEHIKLHGVCLHHDLGALGAAFHPDAARRQLRVMKEMGVNAIRTSHNPPASRFLDLCDEMGLLVDDEAYDMWELPKTAFDNARFFPDTWREDVAAWVRRDRCHPSVIMWSIGNEIQDVHLGERGYQWTCRLTDEARLHDIFGHARVTFGSNYMPWAGAQRAAEYVKLPGYNYAESHYEAHHRAHPDWVIYGSETASMVQSRGIYHFPMAEDILSEEDDQCSALLNSKTSWGIQSLPRMLAEDRLTRYSLGQFVWAGIDYIGEPTPYHTKSSYFGQTDTACYPKDPYYFYQARWCGKPVIHIGVSWKWNAGQLIDVPVMTNCASAELLLNGISLGRKTVCLDDEKACLPVWQVLYADGTLEARGYGTDGQLIVRDFRRSYGDPAALAISAETPEIRQGGLAFLTLEALDAGGHSVDDANAPVTVIVSGAGCLMGLDNGDSTDNTSYQSDTKRFFSGKLLAIVGAKTAGEIRIRAVSPGLAPAEIKLTAAPDAKAHPLPTVHACHEAVPEAPWIRRIDLKAHETPVLTPEQPAVDFVIRREPAEAAGEITLRVTTAQGVDFPGAQVCWLDKDTARVSASADGTFYLRAAASNGTERTRVLSTYPVRAEGFGAVTLDPYELVAGSLADRRVGEIAPGNERGIAFDREGASGVGFSNVDFGPVGSDRLELPIFALDDRVHEISVWDGWPEEGGKLLTVCGYQKHSIWNTYQSQSFTLPEPLKGVHDLYLGAVEKVHLKGFRFERQSRAMRVNRASEADHVYGDCFTRSGDAILDIGNNVTICYEHMEFAAGKPCELWLKGRTAHDWTPVVLQIRSCVGQEVKQNLIFPHSEEVMECCFDVIPPAGECTVNFVFLPGCHFDFHSFVFRERGDELQD